MRRTTVASVAVVILVLVSGCNGLFGSDKTTPSVTPAAVPTDSPTRATPDQQIAPGVSDNGITNASALLTAHTAILNNTSFTRRQNTTTLYTNGSVIFRGMSILRAGDRGEGFYRRLTYDWRSPISTRIVRERIETWSNGDQTFSQIIFSNNTTRYARSSQSFRADASGPPTTASMLRSIVQLPGTLLTPANSTIVTYTTRNDTQMYRIHSMFHTSSMSYTIELLVDERGVIHESTIIRVPTHSAKISITSASYSNIGTTVPPDQPPWYSRAKNATTPTEANIIDPMSAGAL
jgi:hypothetical protein